MSVDGPDFGVIVAYEMTLLKLGTTEPLSLRDITRFPLYATNHRPVVEGSRIPNFAGSPNDFRTVPYHDFREGAVANWSAFEAVVPVVPESAALIGFFRQQFAPYDRPLSREDLSRVVHTCLMFPNWLTLKSDDPMASDQVPIEIAGLVTITRGLSKLFAMYDTSIRLEKLRGVRGKKMPFPTAEELVELMFTEKLLLGDTYDNEKVTEVEVSDSGGAEGEVDEQLTACPAPIKMTIAAIHTLFEDPPGSNEILDRLGLQLSREDVRRIRLLGDLSRESSITLGVAAAYEELLENDGDGERKRRAAMRDGLSRLNPALASANKALNRKKPAPISIASFVSEIMQ